MATAQHPHKRKLEIGTIVKAKLKLGTTYKVAKLSARSIKKNGAREEIEQWMKDEDIKMAFAPLNNHWHKDAPFEKYTFSDFLGDAKTVIINHFPVDAAKKMLFKPVYKKGIANKILLTLMEILVKSHYLGLAAQLSFKHFTNPIDRPMSIS